MKESMIRALLELYESGEATEEQRQLVEAYLAWRQQQNPARKKDEKDPDASLEEILEKHRRIRRSATGEELAHGADDSHSAAQPFAQARPFAGMQPVGETDDTSDVYPMPSTEKRRRYFWIAAAASVIVIFTVGLLWKKTPRRQEEASVAAVYKTIQAAPGKMTHLLLSDSSEVWLNAGARIRYPQPFGNKMRRLELLDGEAFFQVHPDATRGFEVQTEHMLTRVLGTSFNIKAYSESQQMSVAVASGKVSVSKVASEASQIILTPDQQVVYNTGTGLMSRNALAADRMQDWKKGMFDFNGEHLGDIAIELEHYFNVHIQFKYPGIKKYTFLASFPHTMPLKNILTSLCLLNQNRFTQIDAQHYVIH